MLDNSWKRWVAENKLLKISNQDIINTLMQAGIDEPSAKEEVRNIHENPYFQAADSYTQLLHKRHSLAMIQRALAKLDPKHLVIERRSNVSRAEFLEKYYARNRPVILCDLMHNWAATTRWTPEYLKATCGNAMVSIAADRNKNPDYELEVERRTLKFADYVDMVSSNTETNDYYMTSRDGFFKNPDMAPLLNDIEIFPEYLGPATDGIHMWYGPKGTYTPVHHDLINIFLAQVQGRKRVRLIPSTEMDVVYNNDGVYSPVDLRHPDYNTFPKLREASIMEFGLEPGEVLFIPVGWWHDVISLEMSISVSFTNFIFPNSYNQIWTHPKCTKSASQQELPKAVESGLSNDWLMWIDENLKRKCDPMGMVEIMEKKGLALPAIRLAMGENFPKHSPASGGSAEDPPIDYQVLSEVPVARLEWEAGFERIETPKLQLFTLDQFLSDKECDTLLDLISTNLRPSTTTHYTEGFRTSYTSDLSLLKHSFIDKIDQKIALALGIRPRYSEGIQAQKYEVGQEFKPHTDFFEPGTEEYVIHAGTRGNRTWTFMIYLNNAPKGGGTRFVNIDKTIDPKKGMAVIWNNLHASGAPNRDSMHWGMPVEEGQKIIITKWFREKGDGPMFYNDAANS